MSRAHRARARLAERRLFQTGVFCRLAGYRCVRCSYIQGNAKDTARHHKRVQSTFIVMLHCRFRIGTMTPLSRGVGRATGAATVPEKVGPFRCAVHGLEDRGDATASGLLPTAQQLGGTFGVTLAGLCYFGIPAAPTTAFGHALSYETVVFLAAAGLTLAVRHSLGKPAPQPSPADLTANRHPPHAPPRPRSESAR